MQQILMSFFSFNPSLIPSLEAIHSKKLLAANGADPSKFQIRYCIWEHANYIRFSQIIIMTPSLLHVVYSLHCSF